MFQHVSMDLIFLFTAQKYTHETNRRNIFSDSNSLPQRPVSGYRVLQGAFGAEERWRISNPDGSVHVAEMTISPIRFRLHEEVSRENESSPMAVNATTVVIGLLTDDPDGLAAKALAAGAVLRSPVKEYEYGYRQGSIIDPFGHHWCLEGLEGLSGHPSFK
jgi:PhnB protein